MTAIAQRVTDQNGAIRSVRIEKNIYQPQKTLMQRVDAMSKRLVVGQPLEHLTPKEDADWDRESADIATMLLNDPRIIRRGDQWFLKQEVTCYSIFKAVVADLADLAHDVSFYVSLNS